MHVNLRTINLDDAAQLRRKGDGGASFQVRIQIFLERRRLDHGREVGQNSGSVTNLGKQIHLQIGSERIGQAHVAGERRQNQIPHLNAIGGYHVAESVVVVAQEFGKVM